MMADASARSDSSTDGDTDDKALGVMVPALNLMH